MADPDVEAAADAAMEVLEMARDLLDEQRLLRAQIALAEAMERAS